MAVCPRCGKPMTGGICDNCGFPMRRFKKIVLAVKKEFSIDVMQLRRDGKGYCGAIMLNG